MAVAHPPVSIGILVFLLFAGSSSAFDDPFVECTCEDGQDDSACIPQGHLIQLLDFYEDEGYADYAVCSVYPGGGGKFAISHFDFIYEPNPPCVSGGDWTLTGCSASTAYSYSEIDNPAVTSFDDCGTYTNCGKNTKDKSCNSVDLSGIDLMKCDYGVNEGKCVTVRLEFPVGMKLGSMGTFIKSGQICAEGCSLGPSCIECPSPPPPPPTPDLEDACSEFNNGLLPYCYGLDERSANKECGEPYDVSRAVRNEHHHDAFHTKNSRQLRDTPSYNSLQFSQDQFQSMDYFNPRYDHGRFQNGLGKKVSIPLTNGAARVDCPETTTNIRIRLDGLSAAQEIWLAGDSGSEGDWHGRLQGPYTSEHLIKSRGYTPSVPGAGLVVVVEGAGAENVVVSGAVCLFNYGDRTRKVHKIPQQVVSSPPSSRVVEDVLWRPQTPNEGMEETASKEAREEVLTGVADGWSNLEGFASGSGDGFSSPGAKRGYTPNSDCFCQDGLFDYPCTEFCEETLPCTVNMECMKDDQLVFPRQVPEQAVGLITFMAENEDGDLVPFICSGGLIGQTLGHPPGKDCSDDYVDYCPDGYYNNFDSTRFLTSGHCLSDQETADTVEFLFNYSISCEQGITGNCYSSNPPTVEEHPPLSYNYDCAYTTTGADLLISSEDPQFAFIQESADLWLPYGDFTILALTGTLPPQRCYFGYSTLNHAQAFGEVLHRVGHPMGAPRAYAQSQVSDSSVWEGGPMENNPANIEGDYIASLQLNLTDVGMSALGPQGGASGGIVFNDYAQAVGTQTGWTFFWGWIEQPSNGNLDGIHGELIHDLDMDPCNPNYFGPEFDDGSGKTYRVVNQYVVIDGSFYAYFNSVEDELQDLCCPPFLPHGGVVGTTKLDFSINPDGSTVDPPGGQYSGWVGSGVYTRWADWGVFIYTQKPGEGTTWQSQHPPQLFNSSNPCCGDDDLGAPNEVFNGPGEGEGGESGPGANMRRHGWVMIISENNNQEKPDDEVGGGAIIFSFQDPVPIAFVEIIDIDFDEIDGYIQATDVNGHVTELPIVAYGDNAYYRADFYITEIVNVTIFFPGSGSVAGLTFCDVNAPLQNTLGDRVWFDQNANGIQEVYENIGVEGVVVQLHAADRGTGSNQRLAQTITDENGWYQFTSLADGEYQVSFTIDDDLPFFDPYKDASYAGWSWSPPNQGTDVSVDSNAIVESNNDNRAISSVIPLSGGMVDLTWDAGITIDADNICIPRTSKRGEPVVKRKKVSSTKKMEVSSKNRMSYKPKKSTKARK